jgi:tetratricopeptide (TPR) repeat protein
MRIASCLLALLLVCLAQLASAKPVDADAAEARRHYERGMAHFNLREFSKAIESFEAAYRLKPDPVFLYNLAQSHRLLDQHERALYFYRAYLRTSPDAPNRAEVEGRIATLEKVLATQREAAKPPDTPLETKEQPSQTEKAPVVQPTDNAITKTSQPATAPKPVYKRWWLWTVVGAVVVGAGVGLGVGLSQQSTPTYPALRF